MPGGGVALLRAKAAIGKLSGDNADIQAGINIVLRALDSTQFALSGRSTAKPKTKNQVACDLHFKTS